MARKTILTPEQLSEEAAQLRPPSVAPNGDVQQKITFYNQEYSNWLVERVLNRFSASPEFQQCRPLLLGSAAIGGLCLKSDLDFIFLGDESSVGPFVLRAQELGLKLRSRIPQDRRDLRLGVEGIDSLALLQGRGLVPQDDEYLHVQIRMIKQDRKFKQKLLKIILQDQRQRRERFGDIENLLEPNLKFGKGGLRDIQQARQILLLFPEKFLQETHAVQIFDYYFNFFTSLRQKLHSMGLLDTLAASHQAELAQWMGYEDARSCMREIQKGLSRVSFYSQWVTEWALTSAPQIEELSKVKIKSLQVAVKFLKADSSLKHSRILRAQMDDIFRKNKPSAKEVGKFLKQILSVNSSPELLRAAFGSRLVDKMFVNVKRLFGWVQHDQYHRYTADAHIMQACLQVKRFYKKPAQFYALKKVAKHLSEQDWQVISFAAFYHDQAKGLEGDHEIKVLKVLRQDLKKFGFREKFIAQVEWLVRHHLLVSMAAFRKNVSSDQTIAELFEVGAVSENLIRLACFTAIDISATNPDAWNEWKSKLILKLVEALQSKRSQAQGSIIKLCRKHKMTWESLPFRHMDEQLLELIPAKVLFADYRSLQLGFSVHTAGKYTFWISYHNPHDEAGLFARVSGALLAAGLNIRHAFVHTIEGFGVYDWFEVGSGKSAAAIQRSLQLTHGQVSPPARPVEFREVELVSQDVSEWIILFRAKDQVGLLHAAAEVLSQLGLNIKWAKVHTWGRQIEDIFAIQPPQLEGSGVLVKIKQKLKMSQA